jgi:hypothetical protein
MAKGYTSNGLLDSIKVRAAVPEAQNTFEDNDLLRFANEEMSLLLLPAILDLREEFYVYTPDPITIPSNNRIKIPYRAVGGKVRDIRLVDSTNPENISAPLIWIFPEQRDEYTFNLNGGNSNAIRGFYIESGDIVLVPLQADNTNLKLSISYYLSPNDLVTSDRVATVVDTGVDSMGNRMITVDQIPENITIGSTIDIIEHIPQYKTLKIDIQVVNINTATNTITISSDDVPDNFSIGDYICTAQETFVVQAPPELSPLLAQAVACRVLEGQGFEEQLKAATNKLDRMSKALLGVVDVRVESTSHKLVNRNSLLRRNRLGRRFLA